MRKTTPPAKTSRRRFLRDGSILPRPTTVSITLSAPLSPEAFRGDGSDWRAVVELRDAARAEIARHAGEPLL